MAEIAGWGYVSFSAWVAWVSTSMIAANHTRWRVRVGVIIAFLAAGTALALWPEMVALVGFPLWWWAVLPVVLLGAALAGHFRGRDAEPMPFAPEPDEVEHATERSNWVPPVAPKPPGKPRRYRSKTRQMEATLTTLNAVRVGKPPKDHWEVQRAE